MEACGLVCPSPQSSASTGPWFFLLDLYAQGWIHAIDDREGSQEKCVWCQNKRGLNLLALNPTPSKDCPLVIGAERQCNDGVLVPPHHMRQPRPEAVSGRRSNSGAASTKLRLSSLLCLQASLVQSVTQIKMKVCILLHIWKIFNP